jgi:hypothetical protein
MVQGGDEIRCTRTCGTGVPGEASGSCPSSKSSASGGAGEACTTSTKTFKVIIWNESKPILMPVIFIKRSSLLFRDGSPPMLPVKPVKPVKPVAPVKPVSPVNPEPPVVPVAPVIPVSPVLPVKPVEPVIPVKPAAASLESNHTC